MMKSILRFLLAVLVLISPCLTFAEEPKPMTTDSPPLLSPPTLGGKEGGCGAREFEAGEIIVKFRDGVPQASVQSLLLAEGMSILYEMDGLGCVLLSVPRGQELERIEELERNPLVEHAEPSYIVQGAGTITAEPYYSLRALDVIPNDLYFPSQWNLAKIGAPTAWQITTGSDEVIIAVIGTGVDLDHAELRNKIWTNPGEIPGNGIDDDGNGYVDDVHGWDFVNRHGEPQDDRGHGTFVATVAAAETNNGLGITGLSGGAEIMPTVADATSLLFETSLGSLGGVAVTENTADEEATATLPSRVPSMAMITATSDSEVTTTATEFEPGLPYTVTLVAYPTSLAVGDTSTLTATVKDQDNNDVADSTVVTFETSLGSLGSSMVTKTTVSGVAAATLTSQVTGTAVITATSDSKYDTANVIFNPSLPYTVTVEAYPTSIPVRGFTSTITAIVKDQHDNPVADGAVVTFTTDLGSFGSSSVVTTTVSGIAIATLKSASIDGTANVSAALDSVVGQTEVIFLWDGGIAGVSWGAQIMPIKVIKVLPDGKTTGSIDDVNAGIRYATDNGAKILILDFQLFDYVDTLEAAIDYAYSEGILLVAGAGNCGAGGTGCRGINPVMYPGAFPHVLAVAATSQNDDHMSFSEHHPYVDVAAPGERIPGFWLYDYGRLPDTWFAAAQVAGLAALIWSANPALTNDDVESIIESMAVDLGDPCKDDYFGYGRIDANAAVRAALHYLHVEPSILEFRVYDCINPPLQTLTSASPCTWSVTASTPWLSISSSEGYTTTVSINTDSLPYYGVHCAAITAISTLTNCVSYSQTIPVTAVYTQCWRSYLPLILKNHSSPSH
jgi:hypothetical protein